MREVFIEHDDNLGHVAQFRAAAYSLHNIPPFRRVRVLQRRRKRGGGGGGGGGEEEEGRRRRRRRGEGRGGKEEEEEEEERKGTKEEEERKGTKEEELTRRRGNVFRPGQGDAPAL